MDIIIRKATSYETVEEFENLISSNKIKVDDILKVKIYYETQKGLPDYDCSLEKYPVIMDTIDEGKIYLFCLSAGYGGSGPTDLLKILNLAGFNFEKDLIIRKRDIVDITISK